MSTNTLRFQIRLSPEMAAGVELAAAKTGLEPVEWVRCAIVAALSQRGCLKTELVPAIDTRTTRDAFEPWPGVNPEELIRP